MYAVFKMTAKQNLTFLQALLFLLKAISVLKKSKQTVSYHVLICRLKIKIKNFKVPL